MAPKRKYQQIGSEKAVNRSNTKRNMVGCCSCYSFGDEIWTSNNSYCKTSKAIDELFERYREDGEEDVIGPSGVECFCRDLGVHPADRRILFLAWKMNAKKMGYFTREEFRLGFKQLKATSMAQIKTGISKMDGSLRHQDDFGSFYQFSFKFCLTEPGQKIIDVETATEMLEIVYPQGRFVDSFCEFLKEQTSYKKMNLDQWMNFLRFSREVSPDMSDADENPAWPLMMDEFIEWFRSKQKV